MSVERARLALAAARRALRTAEAAVDELEAEVATLRKAATAPRRGVVECICRNPACGKSFRVRAGDIRAGNKAGKFCGRACALAMKNGHGQEVKVLHSP